MKSNILYESIKSNLKESEGYGNIIPSWDDNEGFGSMTNTEAYDAGRSVAKYFSDYAQFLTTEEGSRYVDADLAPKFKELADNLNKSLDEINKLWEEM